VCTQHQSEATQSPARFIGRQADEITILDQDHHSVCLRTHSADIEHDIQCPVRVDLTQTSLRRGCIATQRLIIDISDSLAIQEVWPRLS